MLYCRKRLGIFPSVPRLTAGFATQVPKGHNMKPMGPTTGDTDENLSSRWLALP